MQLTDVSPRFSVLRDGRRDLTGFSNIELTSLKPVGYWEREVRERRPEREPHPPGIEAEEAGRIHPGSREDLETARGDGRGHRRPTLSAARGRHNPVGEGRKAPPAPLDAPQHERQEGHRVVGGVRQPGERAVETEQDPADRAHQR